MRRSLYGKLAAVLLGLLSLIGILYVTLTLFTAQRYLQEVDQKLNRTLAERMVSGRTLIEEGRVDDKAVKKVFTMLMDVNPTIEIYLLDPNGTILAFSAPPEKVKRTKVSLEPIEAFLSEKIAFPILGEDPRNHGRKKVFSASLIPIEGPAEGYLYVILGGEEYDSVAQRLHGSYILRLSIWVALLSLLVALLSGLFFFHLLTRRLKQLASLMEVFKLSNFSGSVSYSSQVDPREGDEIDQLGSAFNEMAGRLVQQMKELQKIDAVRRELVANVSHDLRTPLASLQGYLETLRMREGRLTPEELRSHLQIAEKHSHRLGKLISELFELTKLDSPEAQPRYESFSLAELLQDVVLEFQTEGDQKRVSIRTDSGEGLPFVRADIALIERVLENLLDNALRHTPEGGMITVSLSSDDMKMTIRVTDSGRGISQEDLPYIFDRFYRGEETRSEISEGAGLGLAIAKRILEIHESRIDVVSALGDGATFTFHLPLS